MESRVTILFDSSGRRGSLKAICWMPSIRTKEDGTSEFQYGCILLRW